MGTCLSKKKGSSSSSSLNVTNPVSLTENPHYETNDSVKKAEIFETKIKKKVVQEEEVSKKDVEEESLVKKEVFVIKHRKSHDKKSTPLVSLEQVEGSNCASATSSINTCNGEMGSCNNNNNNNNNVNGGNVVVRTSSCTKEEVDAILIQCGRLSRSNSSGKGVMSSGRKYSGSKRSFDFDNNEHEINNNQDGLEGNNVTECEATRKGNECGEEDAGAERRQHRQRHRQSGRHSSPSSSQGRRRTPSRERDQQNRSGSRERGTGSSSSSGRRVSRSPGRRSENNNNAANNTASNGNNSGTNTGARPVKMVSVPATVSSLVMDKSNNGVETQAASGVKRISVKRNVGAASPRAQSPARNLSPARAARSNNENTQQQPSLSRNSSRKAEHSPYRRNPLGELDPNSLAYPQAVGNKSAAINNSNSNSRAQVQKPNVSETKGTNFKGTTTASMENKVAREQQQIVEEPKAQQQPISASIDVTNIVTTPVTETVKPQQTITRTRSGRRSRDLDINPEVLLNATPSYTTLLLKDIQNFHQKNSTTTTTPPPFSLPPCVTKACSILEAVADLNSTTSSNLSCAFSDDRRSPPPVAASLVAKKQLNTKDPIVESEVNVTDDLMEPSFHKYVTVRRGGTLCSEVDMDGQESSGSNSFVGGGSQQHWGYSTSSWEPNSAESTDRWSSRSNNRDEDEKSPLGLQRHVSSEGGRELEEARRGFSGQRTGIGRGRLGHSKNVHQNPTVAAAST